MLMSFKHIKKTKSFGTNSAKTSVYIRARSKTEKSGIRKKRSKRNNRTRQATAIFGKRKSKKTGKFSSGN